MEVKLLRAGVGDAKELFTMQIKSFRELLEKYQDFDTNPGNESIEKVEAILLCEEIHGKENWELETILQEEKNCYLYEKMGYNQTGKTKMINERLTLVFYEKKLYFSEY